MTSETVVSKILEAASLLFQQQSQQLGQLLALAETAIKQGKPPAASDIVDEEERILAVWDKFPQGTRLTREQIADAIGLSRDNGSLGKHLGRLKAAGRLGNDYPKVPGYYVVEEAGPGQDQRTSLPRNDHG